MAAKVLWQRQNRHQSGNSGGQQLTKSQTPAKQELRGGQSARLKGALLAPSAPWPQVWHPRGLSLPPARPQRLSQTTGRAGGALSGVRQWRPTCFGSDRTVTNRATLAAGKLIESRNHRRPEPHSGQRCGPESCDHQPQRTLAPGAVLEERVSPTRPPCGLAQPLGAGGWVGHFLECDNGGQRALAATEKGGWVGVLRERHRESQGALAATQPSPMPQL